MSRRKAPVLTLARFNKVLQLPTQEAGEVVYNSAIFWGQFIPPLDLPSSPLAPGALSEYDRPTRERLFTSFIHSLENKDIKSHIVHSDRNTVSLLSVERCSTGEALFINRTVFFHLGAPFASVDSVERLGLAY